MYNKYNGLSGVYALICNKNNRMYIGQSVDIGRRIRHHFSYAKSRKHGNKELEADINNHGTSSFSVSVIAETGDAAEMTAIEDTAIKSADFNLLYNKVQAAIAGEVTGPRNIGNVQKYWEEAGYEARSKQSAASYQVYLSRLSDEEKAQHTADRRARGKKQWDSLTPEQQQERINKLHKRS